MSIFQMIFSAIFLIWLFLVLWLLWRHALGGGEHINRLHLILNENTKQSIESAKDAAEAAKRSAETAEKAVAQGERLIALLEVERKGKPPDA